VSGMLMGSMMASMMSPRYVAMAPYATSPGRAGELRGQRASYRAANPQRFAKRSQTGRSYGGSKGTRSAPSRSRGGARFGGRPGLAGAVHLTA
jgi:hypothetical protein